MADPSDRENLIRRMAVSLELTDEETALVLAAPSAHWSKVHDDMADEIRARVGCIDLSAIALEAVVSDPRFAEYRSQFESGEFVIDYERAEQVDVAHERISRWAARTAAAQIRDGFGDLDAPLAEGEYLHWWHICTEEGCDWQLPMEWRNGATTTRLRGLREADALAQAHLETHALAYPNRDDIRARYAEVLAEAEYEKDRELNILPRPMPPWEEASENERTEYRDYVVTHLIDALAAANLPPLPAAEEGQTRLTDPRTRIESVLAEHIPNIDYDGCACGYGRTGEPVWREHLAWMLKLRLTPPGELHAFPTPYYLPPPPPTPNAPPLTDPPPTPQTPDRVDISAVGRGAGGGELAAVVSECAAVPALGWTARHP